MRHCEDRQLFLNRQLDDADRQAFADHLEECTTCKEEVERWGDIEGTIREMLAEGEITRQPGWDDADRLVELRGDQRTKPAGGKIRVVSWAAAAAVIVGISIFTYRAGDHAVAPSQKRDDAPDIARPVITARVFESSGQREMKIATSVDELIESPATGRVLARVGEDQIGLSASGRVRVLDLDDRMTRLELLRGTIACAVTARRRGGEFVVRVDEHTVRVIGTRFSVRRGDDGDVEVHVAEGTVEIAGESIGSERIDAGRRARIVAGRRDVEVERLGESDLARVERLLSDRADEPERHELFEEPRVASHQPDSPERELAEDVRGGLEATQAVKRKKAGTRAGETPSVTEDSNDLLGIWQSWVIAGRLTDAEGALRDYLAKNPSDHRAWSLLAHCLRKGGKWEQSVEAYYRVIALAPPAHANRARFKAGSLLQDRLRRHGQAVVLFEQYLSSTATRSLRVEAMLRLARSLRAVGSVGRAKSILTEVVDRHGGTAGAAKAKQLLKEWE